MSWVIPPLDVLLTFPPPNYVDPPTQNALLLGVEISCFAITAAIVLLRFLVRKTLVTNRRIENDDWLILTATIFAFAMTVENCHAVKYGWCKHIWDVKRSDWEMLLKLTTCTEVIFGLAIGFTKLSILAFYRRVFTFEATSKTFRCCLFTLYGLEICWMIINVSVSVFQCLPVRAIWDVSITDARCNNLFASVASMAALNSLTDIAIFALPIPWVWKLCLPKQQKLAVIGAFGLGFLVIIAGLVRIYYLKNMLFGTWDLTWYGASVYATTAIEVDLGIICASVPALKALFIRSPTTPTSSTDRSHSGREHSNSISNPHYETSNNNNGVAKECGLAPPEWVTNDVELGDIKKLGNDSCMSLGNISLNGPAAAGRKASDGSNVSERSGKFGSF